MRQKTRGIILKYIKYSESSIITDIYTEEFGLQTYIMNSIRSARSKVRIALFQPLTIVNLIVYHRENKSINRIAEISCYHPFHTIFNSIKKTTMAIFLAEFLSKAFKFEEVNNKLFEYVINSIIDLDEKKEGFENYHISLILNMTRHLGIQPVSGENFASQVGRKDLEPFFCKAIDSMMSENNDHKVILNSSQRNVLLMALIDYYKLHIDGFNKINSVNILKEVLN